MQSSFTKSPKLLGVFSLAMINVIAIDSLRTLPVGAAYGLSLIFFYAIATLFFFIPTALVTAELATAWPNTGGAYIWIRTAFGTRWGFVAIWLQWIYNVVWYPTILSFIAGTIAYLVDPQLASNKFFILSVILATWWTVTGLNCLGLQVSSWISTLGALIGTLIPMLVIITLAAIWLSVGKSTHIHFSWQSALPDLSHLNNLAFLTVVIFGLMGLEMSAVHAGDVRHPEKNYPRALLLSVLLILSTLILASLAIAVVIPPEQLNVLSGLTDAYVVFLNNYHLSRWIPLIIALIALGSLCSVSTWVIGPTRGLLIAAHENKLQSPWLKTNNNDMPSGLLILQGLIVTLLSSVFVMMPSVSSAYWLLSIMTSQLALLFYVFLFAAALRLHYKAKATPRVYRIPGGKLGIWLITILGVSTCLVTFSLGFIPPAGVPVGNLWTFEAILILGLIAFCLPPLVLNLRYTSNTDTK